VLVPALRCPGRPSVALRQDAGVLRPEDGGPEAFPIVAGTPILINEAASVFEIADFSEAEGVTTMDLRDDALRYDTPVKKIKAALLKLIPPISRSSKDFSVHDALAQLSDTLSAPKVLVVGAGDVRFDGGIDACIAYTDVALAPDTQIIADCHDIPFADGTFDVVVVVAVLEHVANPYRCIDEIRRVLVPGGYVYAVTPFMQQVHMGRYDFTRFTALGHRRAFSWFDELRSGVANGPGMVIAWSMEYMVSTFFENAAVRKLSRTISRFLTWLFLLLDPFLVRKSGAYDCASAYYFFGRLRDEPLSDREILKTYRGRN
jgi:hypothetical protein